MTINTPETSEVKKNLPIQKDKEREAGPGLMVKKLLIKARNKLSREKPREALDSIASEHGDGKNIDTPINKGADEVKTETSLSQTVAGNEGDEDPLKADRTRNIPENSDKKERELIYRPISKGETFEGGMPIIKKREDIARFNKKAVELYGEIRGRGKWGVVLMSGDKATKIYSEPDNILSAYDYVFMSRHGGKAGLPKFYGAVPNGYTMEAIEGETLANRVNKTWGSTSSEGREGNIKGVLSQKQGQQLLDRIAEYHQETGRVHGDLTTSKSNENIIITPDGEVRFIDTEWERVNRMTPEEELNGMYKYLTESVGLEGLELPETTEADIAARNLVEFMAEVKGMVTIDPVINKVVSFNDSTVVIKTTDSGEILVGEQKKA